MSRICRFTLLTRVLLSIFSCSPLTARLFHHFPSISLPVEKNARLFSEHSVWLKQQAKKVETVKSLPRLESDGNRKNGEND
jgi:hypothetical protein